MYLQKKKITRKRKGPQQEAATAQEAIQKIIQEKRISCKINYDVLNDLNVKSSVPSVSRVKSEMTLSGPLTDNSLSISRLRKASVGFDLKPEVRYSIQISVVLSCTGHNQTSP